jgi:HEAT repeat protein
MGSGARTGDLETDRRMLVLARRQAGATTRIRALSWSCAVDAGDLPLVWLDAVAPADSVRFLDGVVRDARSGQELIDSALMALATHAEPSAVEALISAARRERRRQVRSQALFWLSQKAGRRAVEAIAQAVDEDPESQVRERAVFALSQLPQDEGVPRLIELARSHRDPNVRAKAMFWLGQSGDDRALAFFEQVLAR